ncbi:unnamed protein product, partial [Choristocarpus tenellus]
AANRRRGVFNDVLMPTDALFAPFAGGTDRDMLPGRLESLVFPERYINWPEQPLVDLARDVTMSSKCYSMGFQSGQPRIVFNESQKATRGWGGPGAY